MSEGVSVGEAVFVYVFVFEGGEREGGKLEDMTNNERIGSPWHWIDPAGTELT